MAGPDEGLLTLRVATMNDESALLWPAADFSRVPYGVFGSDEVFAREQGRIFRGPVWCYLALEAEIPSPGDYVTTFIGNTQAVVTRDEAGHVHAFVNRCAHRGTTLVRDLSGHAQDFTCIYHHWCYDLKGNLIGVPFERGMNGQGGMPDSFRKEDHGLRTLRVATYRGVVFATFSAEVEPLEDYLGAAMREFLDRMFRRPVEILGYMRQRMPANWKLYYENVKDPYHAGLLHQFGTTFGIWRNTQAGGSVMDEARRHELHYTEADSDVAEATEAGYQDTTVFHDGLTLEDPAIVDFRDETGDGLGIMMMTIFPNVLFQQLSNTWATRQIRPKNPHEFELYWTHFGYQDDDPELRAMRLKQANLTGPAGYVSMEDGEAGVLAQRAVGQSGHGFSVIEMGGGGDIAEGQDHVLTEVPIRGFWKNYCELMGYTAASAASTTQARAPRRTGDNP